MFSKLFETISTRLVSYHESHSLLSECQHEFRANDATETTFLQLINNLYTHLGRKCHVTGIFIDAFDSLNHKILLDKLEHMGIRGVPHQLFKTYIDNKSQSVYCNSTYSLAKYISKGIPQGFILGPINFLIYLNGIIVLAQQFYLLSMLMAVIFY